MDDIKEKELQREAADDKLIEAAFKECLTFIWHRHTARRWTS